MEISFTKMDGLGNDFVVFRGPLELTKEQVINYCTSAKVDGALVVTAVHEDLVQMQYWNADGSVAEMCGNGLRCVTRYAVDNNLVAPGSFNVKTGAGLLKVTWKSKDPSAIEVQVGKVTIAPAPITIENAEFFIADVGNPHAVTFGNNVDDAPVLDLGPRVETNEHFPNKTNVGFAQIVSTNKIRLRTWERGVGETKACGTSMVATANIATKFKGTVFPVEVEVPGGKAKIWLDTDGYTCMMGPAKYNA